MWPESPARNNRPCDSGEATKLRNGAIDFSIDGPVTNRSDASAGSRRRSSSQNRSSDQSSMLSSSGHCT